ncbi:MAG: methylenetetrahydrofolate reductase [NAD(P)H] [Bacteroidetes bacterium]|nr:methylenetetrahydrofolate reductase [NAD(P)H] [Bacteroidota bacterium]
MKVTEHLQNASSTLFSFEVLPPMKGKTIQDLFRVMDPLMEFKPPFVDVTYHREEIVYKKRADGLVEKVPTRKRPGTVGICAAITAHYKIDAVPHLVCGGFTKEETEDAIFTLHYLGIQNFLLLRGDGLKSEPRFQPSDGGHHYASDLVAQVANMNRGRFLHEETATDAATDFCIGVAGYPEKHFEAPNMSTDLRYLKHKVDQGADYIVTQMFFDNKVYFDFVKRCREMGITVPIIPGLKPITAKPQISTLPPVFHLDIPDELVNAVSKAPDNKAAEKIGIEWAIQQSRELIEFGVPCVHYYSMSKAEPILAIARAVF